jgi:translation initiation factor 1
VVSHAFCVTVQGVMLWKLLNEGLRVHHHEAYGGCSRCPVGGSDPFHVCCCRSMFWHGYHRSECVAVGGHRILGVQRQVRAHDEVEMETFSPDQQPLKVILETKHRAGKTVTVVYGFVGKDEDINQLGKALKNHCGTGGSVKDGEIIIQGDHRQKVFQYLKQKGYNKAKL